MATAMIQIPFQEELLQQIDRFVERKVVPSREDLIHTATKMYIQQKRNWQNLFAYGERLALDNNLSEEDIMNEIKANRYSK
jgi:metal-responsive CopG/Arc/MetJ family transcriptional regulator